MLTGMFDHKPVIGVRVREKTSLIRQWRRLHPERWVTPLEHRAVDPFPSAELVLLCGFGPDLTGTRTLWLYQIRLLAVPASRVAERMLPRDWRLFRDWGWHGAERNTDPNGDRQIDDLSRPGASTAGLNWYRANLGSVLLTEQHDKAMVAISCPTMGVWSPPGTSS
jgi:hypothetical protein